MKPRRPPIQFLGCQTIYSDQVPPGTLYLFPVQPDDPREPRRPPIRITDIGMEVDPCDPHDNTELQPPAET